jgi:NADH-quinone oxidoreductase subunit N
MNVLLLKHELTLIVLGLGVLLADLWLPPERKRSLGYLAALGVGAILLCSLMTPVPADPYAFGQMFVLDGMALFFKRFFLVATILVLLMAVEFADRIQAGVSEYYSLILFAAAGMMFAASANDFALLFVSLELITVTFYVLVSFQRGRAGSL